MYGKQLFNDINLTYYEELPKILHTDFFNKNYSKFNLFLHFRAEFRYFLTVALRVF